MIGSLDGCDTTLPQVDLKEGPIVARAVAACIREGLVCSAHDCSEGGVLVAAAEMAFGGDLGVKIDLQAMPCTGLLSPHARAFAEDPSRYLLEVSDTNLARVRSMLGSLPNAVLGRFDDSGHVSVAGESMSIKELREAWSSGGEGW
jgi:phosphoribosylformylglycinamidine synthase